MYRQTHTRTYTHIHVYAYLQMWAIITARLWDLHFKLKAFELNVWRMGRYCACNCTLPTPARKSYFGPALGTVWLRCPENFSAPELFTFIIIQNTHLCDDTQNRRALSGALTSRMRFEKQRNLLFRSHLNSGAWRSLGNLKDKDFV